MVQRGKPGARPRSWVHGTSDLSLVVFVALQSQFSPQGAGDVVEVVKLSKLKLGLFVVKHHVLDVCGGRVGTGGGRKEMVC